MEYKILVGLDDSVHSWRALGCAIEEAKVRDLDKITVVHSEEGGGETEIEEYRTSEEILEKAEEVGKKKNISIETHLLVRGYEPDIDIVKFAEDNDFNHIILGSKGRTGLERILLGSVAEGVVEKANCCVTIVRGECPLPICEGELEC